MNNIINESSQLLARENTLAAHMLGFGEFYLWYLRFDYTFAYIYMIYTVGYSYMRLSLQSYIW